MPAWSWFVVALLIGAALLVVAVLVDRRARRRVTGAGEPAPRRGLDEVDRHVPRYVTQDEIDALPSPASGQGAGPLPHAGEGFGFGHAHPDFATDREGARYQEPRILIVDGEVSAMRELMTPLAEATPELPLVVVAAGIHPEVLTTLAANRRALRLPVVAAVAGARDRVRLAELLGVAQVPASDLRAGYLPPGSYGLALEWTSTLKRAWVEPRDLP
ncbi:hypothetical protein [Tessaracoccus sp. G1721]